MPEKQTMIEFNRGGAFYSLTPRRILEDLQGVGLNKLKANPPYPSFKKVGIIPAFTLAEGATHVDTFHDIRKPAFTLAEVLVTLGIIGVVAAMTLPMLAKNYQFYVRQQQFKKAYAALDIAVQKTQIDMGEGVKCYYMTTSGAATGSNMSECPYFWQELMKNIHVVKTCKKKAREKGCIPKDGWRGGEDVYAETQGGSDPDAAKDHYTRNCGGFNLQYIDNSGTVYMTNSGSIIMPYASTHHMGIFAIDINGHKGPNKWGYDIFIFDFLKAKQHDSVFKLNPSRRCHPIETGGYYTKTYFDYLYQQYTNR